MKKGFLFLALPLIGLLSFVSCGDSDEETKDNPSNVGGHEYVDLDLPSGLKWATCNVGATLPEGYGDYFAWGEVKSKSLYTLNTYKWVEIDQNGEISSLKKYNDGEYYAGQTDNLTILLAEDDAATANWGSDWRMPTEEEWRELSKNCEYSWEEINGVKGLKFTGKNGKWIFLPAAGSYEDGLFYDEGEEGHYWSSSLRESDNSLSFCPHIKSGGMKWKFEDRSIGVSVRPVLKK